MNDSTRSVRRADKDTTGDDFDIPAWATLPAGERAREGLDLAIGDLRKMYEREIDRALLKLWHDPFREHDVLHRVATIRQYIAIAMIMKERTEKLIERLRAKAG